MWLESEMNFTLLTTRCVTRMSRIRWLLLYAFMSLASSSAVYGTGVGVSEVFRLCPKAGISELK
jgi:hypothetical protein